MALVRDLLYKHNQNRLSQTIDKDKNESYMKKHYGLKYDDDIKNKIKVAHLTDKLKAHEERKAKEAEEKYNESKERYDNLKDKKGIINSIKKAHYKSKMKDAYQDYVKNKASAETNDEIKNMYIRKLHHQMEKQ